MFDKEETDLDRFINGESLSTKEELARAKLMFRKTPEDIEKETAWSMFMGEKGFKPYDMYKEQDLGLKHILKRSGEQRALRKEFDEVWQRRKSTR